jgi:hypothetical protein
MSGVFISYRRDDTTADAGRLFDDLQRRCARNQIFWDAEIPPGPDYRQVLNQKLEDCDIVLVLIGPEWLHMKDAIGTTGDRGRLEGANDPVRLEIVTALSKNKRIIPVLLRGAKMPREEELPEAIRQLAYCNAFAIRHDRWKADLNELVGHFPRKLGCVREIPNTGSWKVWAELLVLPVILFLAIHTLVVFKSELLVGMDFMLFTAALSSILGGIQSFQFRSTLREKALIGIVISISTAVLASIVVPLLTRDSIIPTRWTEVRLFALYVASQLAGYLTGGLLIDVVLSRRRDGFSC